MKSQAIAMTRRSLERRSQGRLPRKRTQQNRRFSPPQRRPFLEADFSTSKGLINHRRFIFQCQEGQGSSTPSAATTSSNGLFSERSQSRQTSVSLVDNLGTGAVIAQPLVAQPPSGDFNHSRILDKYMESLFNTEVDFYYDNFKCFDFGADPSVEEKPVKGNLRANSAF